MKGVYCLVFLSGLVLSSCSRQLHERYELGDGFVIHIEHAKTWEVNRVSYYRVTSGSVEVVPKTYIELHQSDKPILVSGSGIFGIATKDKPSEIIVLFETSTLDSWPWRGKDKDFVSTKKRAEALLDKLNKSFEFKLK